MIGVDPTVTVQQISSGDYRSQCLHIVVGLGLADAPHELRPTAGALVEPVHAQPVLQGLNV